MKIYLLHVYFVVERRFMWHVKKGVDAGNKARRKSRECRKKIG